MEPCARPSRRGGRFLRLLLRRRPGILAPGVDVAVDEPDHRHRRRAAFAEPGLAHARIAAVALLVAWADDVKQLLDHGDVADLGDGLAPRVQIAALAQRDELFHDRAQILGLRQRGDDLLVLDQRGRHVAEHGAAMLRRAVELAVGVTVAHRVLRFLRRSFRSSAWAWGPESTRLSNGPRSAWPARRYCPGASRALPCRGAGPSAPALP